MSTTAGTTEPNEPGQIGRRTALKVGVGIGAGAVVWAEPTIKGLVRRPAYAAGASGPVTESITITGFVNGSTVSGLVASPPAINGVAIVLTPTTYTNPNNGNVLARIQVDSPGVTFTLVTDGGQTLPPRNTTVTTDTPINNNGSRLRLRQNLNQAFTIVVDMTCA